MLDACKKQKQFLRQALKPNSKVSPVLKDRRFFG